MEVYPQVGVSCEPEVIGVKNGVYQFTIDEKQFGDRKAYDNFLSRFRNEDTIADFLKGGHITLKAKLLKKAKATDLMKFSPYIRGIQFAVSKKALNVLQQFNLGAHYTIGIKFDNSEVNNYFLLWLPFTEVDKVVFKDSILYSGDKFNFPSNPLKYQPIQSLEEYNSNKFKVKFEKVVFNKSDIPFDIVMLRGVGTFISEKLKKAIQENNLIGFVSPQDIKLDLM